MMKRAFTLIELLVVIGMITVLTGSISSSVASARARARVMKATAEVKEMTNAILAYENYARGGKYRLDTMRDAEAGEGSVGFILGKGQTTDSGDKIPVLYNGSVSADGKIKDPWGRPYRVTIEQGSIDSPFQDVNMLTGYFLPNFYRLSIGEMNQ